MKRKRFEVKSRIPEDMALQITPMASVFTVILVFLLKSVSMSVSNITPSQELTLPEVSGSEEVFEGMRVEISPNAILVDDVASMPLDNFEFEPKDLAEDGSFKQLNAAIGSKRGLAAIGPDANRILVLADVRTPYNTLKRVLASAANSGYYDLKLIVVEDQK